MLQQKSVKLLHLWETFKKYLKKLIYNENV